MNGANGDASEHSPKILALEIEDHGEDEHESLLRETTMDESGDKTTTFFGRNADNLRRRARDGGGDIDTNVRNIFGTGNSVIQGLLRGDLMSHAMYHIRNALMLGLLAFFVLVVLEWEGGLLRSEQVQEVEPAEPLEYPHQMSFGGKNNPGHNIDPDKEKKPLSPLSNNDDDEFYEPYIDDYGYEGSLSMETEILSEATEMSGNWDISFENTLNEQAHYLHDPLLSPFASELYEADQDILDERQAQFTQKMRAIVDQFGQWNDAAFQNLGTITVDEQFYSSYDYRDVIPEEFPEGAWQKNKEYITLFLDQAQALVNSTINGIMQEYNHPNPDDTEKKLFGGRWIWLAAEFCQQDLSLLTLKFLSLKSLLAIMISSMVPLTTKQPRPKWMELHIYQRTDGRGS